MTEIRIPKPGDAIHEGTIGLWRVKEGQQVEPGDILYELETEKTTLEIEASVSGQVHLIGVEGETYPIGELIATIE
ncbi:MAG: biotin/lipoyl-binding protein [bacterium]|nr:dihydrolipoamide acyltransferase [Deltaproteobacteria bacterium]MCP4903566.1 biotin/lipoyl-binding protein [bacterium]